MSNSPHPRKATPRSRVVQPVVQPVAEPDDVQLWDEYVKEAEPDVEPWQKRLPDGSLLAVGCPSSAAIDELAEAQMVGDVVRMVKAVFGEDSERVLELTAQRAFTVRIRLVNDVMLHYGMSAWRLPESAASSR